MNKAKTYVALAGAGMLFTAGCSVGGSPEVTPSSERSLQTSPAPEQSPTNQKERNDYLAKIALSIEQAFEDQIGSGVTHAQQVTGLCSAIAYDDIKTHQRMVAIVGNPVTLSASDDSTGETLSIAVAYDKESRAFIYGQALLASEEQQGVASQAIEGPTEQLDMFPPNIDQSVIDVALSWPDTETSPIDQNGNTIMDVVSKRQLQGSLEAYVQTADAVADCLSTQDITTSA